MQKQLTNHDINEDLWLAAFTRDELKTVAKKNGIGIPSNKEDLAYNLMRGYSASQTPDQAKTFKVRVSI
jgi:hypothetical protein